MPRRPTDGPSRQSVVSDQGWRVAFAAWTVCNIEILAGDAPNGLQQLLHGCPMAGPKIQGIARAVIKEVLDCTGICAARQSRWGAPGQAGEFQPVQVRPR